MTSREEDARDARERREEFALEQTERHGAIERERKARQQAEKALWAARAAELRQMYPCSASNIHTRMHARMHVYMHAHIYACMHAFMHTCIHACMNSLFHCARCTGALGLPPETSTRARRVLSFPVLSSPPAHQPSFESPLVISDHSVVGRSDDGQ